MLRNPAAKWWTREEIEQKMDDKTEKYLWEELKLLQPIIDKFDNLSFQIKKWFLGILVAVAGVAIVREKPALIIFNFFLVLVFYYAEAAYRAAHDSFLTRGRQIQRVLRGEETLEKSEMPPHLDRFLVHGDKELAVGVRHHDPAKVIEQRMSWRGNTTTLTNPEIPEEIFELARRL